MTAKDWPTTRSSVLKEARHGHGIAWERLDHDYRPVIVQYAVARGLSKQDAEDVAQDVFAHLFDQLAHRRFQYDRRRGRFRGWLAKVIRQRAWRVRQSRDKLSVDKFDTVTIAELARSPEWHLKIEISLDVALEQVCSELTERERQVFDLYWQQRLKPQQISQRTDYTSAQVSKIVFRCRRRLYDEARRLAATTDES